MFQNLAAEGDEAKLLCKPLNHATSSRFITWLPDDISRLIEQPGFLFEDDGVSDIVQSDVNRTETRRGTSLADPQSGDIAHWWSLALFPGVTPRRLRPLLLA